eukprot:GHVN01022611.1.p1 GENE.GHVN01022611.1~~GHVN01022611.1.p1  ORF type:complete len:463 (+),score=79.89 GHVN01022611.1:151-1389(+)
MGDGNKKEFELSVQVMMIFAHTTGLIPPDENKQRVRYLWTDAWAVINCVGLSRMARHYGENKSSDKMLRLGASTIAKTQQVLGSHRRAQFPNDSDNRSGPLTNGGMRIGKAYSEDLKVDPHDDPFSYDRDGQYFHYLTKWLNALCLFADETNDASLAELAVRTANQILPSFHHVTRDGSNMLYWKMSIDLTHPTVRSMGAHDAVDGLIAYLQVKATADRFQLDGHLTATDHLTATGHLSQHINLLSKVIDDQNVLCRSPRGSDSLEAGGLLINAVHLSAMMRCDSSLDQGDLLVRLLRHSLPIVKGCHREMCERPIGLQRRLPFRDFGLSTGLKGVVALHENENNSLNMKKSGQVWQLVDEILAAGVPVLKEMESWNMSHLQTLASWRDHEQITNVMYASHLCPKGFLFEQK